MANYRTNLSELELNKLNLIENKEIRNSCMSILSYLLKKHTEEIEQYAEANLENLKNQSTFKISLRKFLEKYNRSHQKLSLGTLKNRIDLLLKYKLIKLECKSTYSFFRHNKLNNSFNKNLNKKNVTQAIDTTTLQAPRQKHKYLNTKINNKNNINNSVAHVTQTKIFVNSIEEINNQLEYHISKFNISYDFAIREIKRRVNRIVKAGTLRFTGVENYLISVLSSIKNQFIPNSFKQKNKANTIVKEENNTTIDTKTSVLEDLNNASKNKNNKEINTNYSNTNNKYSKKQDSFNNYEQRSYDFDELEKQLLGW